MSAAAVVVARSHFVADMSAFLPRSPTAQQQLLVDQVTRGALSRTLLLGIEGGTAGNRAELSRELGRRMRDSGQFDIVSNGSDVDEKEVGEIFLRYRYFLSDKVTSDRFTVAGLHTAIAASIDNLSSSLGGALKDLLARDPTGEMFALVNDLDDSDRPRTDQGVWVSRDGQRAVLVAVTHAAGADTDAQERLLQDIRRTFDAAKQQGRVADARILISGAAVFAVDARTAIRTQVTRLSLIGGAGMMAMLLLAFRSFRALGVCLMPVLSAALLGTAMVSLLFGSVHGITIGFGSTLIGEAVDYSIYYMIQSQPRSVPVARLNSSAAQSWLADFWPTVRLGMFTSVCGYVALLFSGFPGLAQLGAFSISGLITAALVTRFVLPRLAVSPQAAFPSPSMVAGIARGSILLRRLPWWICGGALLALVFLVSQRGALWNPALSGLSPVSIDAQRVDASLRADLAAPQMRFLVIVEAPDQEAALRGAEAIGVQLRALQEQRLIEGFESPSKLVPSRATQERRRAALPEPDLLERRLRVALKGLPLRAARLQPFIDDIKAVRGMPLLTREQLGPGGLGFSFDAMMMQGERGVTTFIPVRQGRDGYSMHLETQAAREAQISGALAAAARVAQESVLGQGEKDTRIAFIDMAEESAQIYAGYFNQILVFSGLGVLAIVILLGIALKDWRRMLAVLIPLALAVLFVMAGLVALGERLNLLHVVGLLLIVAVGSNYALFVDKSSREPVLSGGGMEPATLQSLLLASTLTTIGFGVLAFSTVPVLRALGVTVAPGAILALVLSMVYAHGPGRAKGA
jgi:predicted exporter